jgi:hypothetical protein
MRLRVKYNIVGHNKRLFVSNYSSVPIQISGLYHATCFPGLEKYLVKELEEIKGIHSINMTKAGISLLKVIIGVPFSLII